jgi:kynurenine formamidase
MSGYTKLGYGPHPNNHALHFNNPAADHPSNSTLIYIHGGAWRDASRTAEDVVPLSSLLNKEIPLASVEYRLTPEVKYPEHLNDVNSGIQKLIESQGIQRISLLGHSVGATLILQLLEAWNSAGRDLKSFVDSVYLVEGIYDLKELVKEYPTYEGFVNEAHDDYKALGELEVKLLKGLRVHVVHSYQDELLSLGQTNWLSEKLKDNEIEHNLFIGNLGLHDEVPSSAKLAEFVNTTFR